MHHGWVRVPALLAAAALVAVIAGCNGGGDKAGGSATHEPLFGVQSTQPRPSWQSASHWTSAVNEPWPSQVLAMVPSQTICP